MVYDPFDRRTAFVVFEKGSWRTIDAVTRTNGERLVPYSADNSLIKHDVVLFPSEPEEYGTTTELTADIRSYIHRYVGLSERFELLATHYALFSWVHDRFAELPYLRLRGDFGTGKDVIVTIAPTSRGFGLRSSPPRPPSLIGASRKPGETKTGRRSQKSRR